MTFQVVLSRPAARTLARLDAPTEQRILAALDVLAVDPLTPAHSEPLQGAEGLRHAGVGGLRVLSTPTGRVTA